MFTISSGIAVALYAAAGLYTRETLLNLGLLIPGMLAGFGIAGLLDKQQDWGIPPILFRVAASGGSMPTLLLQVMVGG